MKLYMEAIAHGRDEQYKRKSFSRYPEEIAFKKQVFAYILHSTASG
jgi:hypothetical protein